MRRAAGEKNFGGVFSDFFNNVGLFLQWYMVVFITVSMQTIKTNLFNKCIWTNSESSYHLLPWLCNMKIIWSYFFIFHFKKSFSRVKEVLIETPHHGNVSKNRLNVVNGGGAKSLKTYRRLPFHFHGTLCI